MVDIQQVTKQYGEKLVIDDVSVCIPQGKITSFIGPNGAGKSTLLSMVSRLLKKDAGQILIDQHEVTQYDSRELAKKLSILKQANTINIRLTVKDLVSFGRFPYSQGALTKEDHRLIDEAIRYMDLTDLEDRYLDQLSGGQKQRAFIAMVIAQDTDYVLLDEPLNNLDMKHSVQIMKVLRQMVEELGKTVVIVLHDINFASCYLDYIVALKNGKVVRQGPKNEIIDREALRDIYDMDMEVNCINDQKICVYFT
ncbi:ABC transporter ATP-binding protein [Halalkalibacterium halodurans]|uniref:Ferrichrome ABC transporter (ATP-binding protein) n=1 Tax=Halalkalibacterium halodurans (strain ATCC BAA-125 / DSM 18197 / FERM 7344 / JCM 9153 / C-125) TaxID=272558 RepID=Q9KE31_HALH5|nr:ABC transporter ATP-binding protein [Halalkalibacterium halodurans]MED4080494.1 ABC transporter ATP-binding protein [Halalkalibacterium halodurans]MED4086493.1 ABC transporter ATP-binding protein [Halalkalibacterium halodurans]MED4104798.1 ABC transporter ATP-binding protein [Halalkalibacterium halodurans]MED4109625.1 ABC transporter ATP-binding protein [Halalkalibacterium halodurans]MED4150096.1 ABC transporter ATP-binding protein [Halalkalibacterium halodurans]